MTEDGFDVSISIVLFHTAARVCGVVIVSVDCHSGVLADHVAHALAILKRRSP